MEREELFAEKLMRVNDLMAAEIKQLRLELDQNKEILELKIKELDECNNDHEARIRSMHESVASFKVKNSVAAGMANLLSIVALIRTFTGF
jgi:hypothetical protein